MGRATLINFIRRVHLYRVATRYCGRSVRRWVFDQMHTSGKWNFDDASPELIAAIEDHSSNGAILLLGCGNASILRHLKADAYRFALGIDISPEAVSRAGSPRDPRDNFEVGDILEYQCQQDFDVILLAESLYYIKANEQGALLKRLRGHLTSSGCIIVTVVNPKGHTDIIQLIRSNFSVLRETNFKESDRFLIVFR